MFIVRYSEIGLKGSKARERMEQLLIKNISTGLQRLSVQSEIKKGYGRIYILNETDADGTADVLSRTMGIKSYSRAVSMKFDTLEDIKEKSLGLWSETVRGKKFAVRARRTGQHDFSSRDIMSSVGEVILPHGGRVDLENPEVELDIEVRENTAYFFTESGAGPGGLPLGSEGKLVALVSGGIDSPVAAWTVMKRGSPTDMIFCSLAPPIDTKEFLDSVRTLVQKWGHGYDPRIHILDGTKLVEVLTDEENFKYANITFKRVLYLLAEKIAERSHAHGIVTGESLGQVSSQTPESLHATSHNLDIPVMRPLLGYDKDEIVMLARRIGTFPESSRGEFCSLFASRPITRPRVSDLEEDMRNFDILEEILETDRVIKGSEISEYLMKLREEDVETSDLPENSIVVDLRSAEKYDEWHFPGAVNVNFRALDTLFSKKTDGTYVFYCMKGLQSAYAASKARSVGAKAYFIRELKLRKMIKAE